MLLDFYWFGALLLVNLGTFVLIRHVFKEDKDE